MGSHLMGKLSEVYNFPTTPLDAALRERILTLDSHVPCQAFTNNCLPMHHDFCPFCLSLLSFLRLGGSNLLHPNVIGLVGVLWWQSFLGSFVWHLFGCFGLLLTPKLTLHQTLVFHSIALHTCKPPPQGCRGHSGGQSLRPCFPWATLMWGRTLI